MKRILCIDGGGIKGALPASFLSSLEEAIGERIVDYFDLIAGTSTGGIIALGLGLGFSAAEIKAFYENEGPSIFATFGLFASPVEGVEQRMEANPAVYAILLHLRMHECRLRITRIKLWFRTALRRACGAVVKPTANRGPNL